MTLCPIAIAVGCKKCPAFAVCPLKGVIGDAPAASEKQPGAAEQKGTQGGAEKGGKAAAKTTRSKGK